jgi:molybdopterin guanine dinucleotide-containing S/N-oxide reductase-like protein
MSAIFSFVFSSILTVLYVMMRMCAWRHPAFRSRLGERDYVAQVRVRDHELGRWFAFKGGRVTSHMGIHPHPDVTLSYETAEQAVRLMIGQLLGQQQTEAAKLFRLQLDGPDDVAYHFTQTLIINQRINWKIGTDMPDGTKRFASLTNGGPVFAYVKDGKIVRITPMDFTEEDAKPWTIKARGHEFTPPHRSSLAPHGQCFKSLVYSPDRMLYPMRRVDFDPKGERNPQNRGKSGYVRISWDEAFDIVTDEIKRLKRDYGPSSMIINHPSHQALGNIGYWDSAMYRFGNAVGHTKMNHNPDSWEGWFWGAVHHWGHSMRLGHPEFYGTCEDLLKNCEMVVFWSSDPEATNGLYAGHDGSIRRQWVKDLDIPTVHVDPYLNGTASFMRGKWLAPRPGSDTALAMAIAYVWIKEGLYDKEFVAKRTIGFDAWKAYIMGDEDGVAKTPEWQEVETGIPAREARALAREWGNKRTYFAPGGWGAGFGGACRAPTGIQWARAMVCIGAMQGMGRPGVNFGNMQNGTPVDLSFYFPGYGEGGISGDLGNTGSSISLYQRMPHLLSMNSSPQQCPRMSFPEAILGGSASGYPRDARSIEGQFTPQRYPTPGQAKVRMIYKYGSSNFATMPDSHRYVDMYQSDKIDMVVNQSIWFEGDAKFADIILPACTSFERNDIAEWSGVSGFAHHLQSQLNNRCIVMLQKCIEPLGESKSDYDIFLGLCQRLGLGTYFSEGMADIDWVQRMFAGSDLPTKISWKKFMQKGYYVVPPIPESLRPPVSFKWFYEGRKKDVPEPHPLPCEYRGNYLDGLQTPSGKFEFECTSLKRLDPPDPGRPPVLHYERAHEDITTDRAKKYPLQLMSPHPRYSFHTHADGKDSFINDIEDHRVMVDGKFYWVLRVNPIDAKARGIKHHQLVKIFNNRGAVICVAQLTGRVRPGVVHGYESCARYETLGEPGKSVEVGGTLNVLTPKKNQLERVHALGNSNCLVQVEAWNGRDEVLTRAGVLEAAE